VIWVYAICEWDGLRLPDLRGLGGAPVEAIVAGPLLAFAGEVESAEGALTVDALTAHEQVVEALMDERAVLPMRFGTTFAARGALVAALAARREPMLDALERVRGRVELAVRARAEITALTVPVGTGGRDYVRARLRADRSAASLHEPLAALAVAARRWPSLAPGEVLRASYLVEQPDVARFRDAVQALQHEHPEAALVCTGPWPAYSFVGEAGG
jgi:Gas vesicle synthesis protein GvpL/GvpF